MSYLSVVMATRADDFGGLQRYRMNLFFEFCDRVLDPCFHQLSWELVLVDANPNLFYPALRSWIGEPFISRSWMRVLEIPKTFPPANSNKAAFPLHESVNFGLRHCRGKFTLITNFDVFPSESVLREISQGNLREDAFYLADRLDDDLVIRHDFESLKNKIFQPGWNLECEAHGLLQVRHSLLPWSWCLSPIQFALEEGADFSTRPGSRRKNLLFEFSKRSVAFWRKSTGPLARLSAKLLWSLCYSKKIGFGRAMNWWLAVFGVHTNASGDFILAKTSHLQDLGGFVEDQEDFWHRDSDLVIRMIKKGLRQAVFLSPGFVYHLVTKESGRNDPRYREKRSYDDFCRLWLQTLSQGTIQRHVATAAEQ